MATIIDSLLVTLGIDSSNFDAGRARVQTGLRETGNEAESAGKKIKKAGDDGAEGFDNVTQSVVKFLAVIGGTMAVKRFTTDMIESSAALERLSRNIGTGVQTITAWGNAASIAGGTASGLQGTMRMLSKEQANFLLTGESGMIPYLSALGVAMMDTQGKARPVADMLLDVGQALMARTPDRQTAFNMGLSMGIDEGTLNLILRGRKEVEALLKQQAEYAAAMRKFAPDAEKLNRLIVEGKQAFMLFGLELLQKSVPAIEKMLDVFSGFGKWIQDNQEFVETFLTIVAVGLAGVALAVVPINALIFTIAGLAAGIAALYQDYQVWKRGGETLIDWDKWEPGIKKAGEGIQWLRGLLTDVVYRAIAAADVMGAIFARDWDRLKFAADQFVNGNGFYDESTPPSAEGQDAISYFQSQGWTKEQATGIAANIKSESNFNPAAVGDGGKAYGIAQWHPDRQEEFKKLFGKPIQGSTIGEQLAFMQHELTQGNESKAGAMLKGTSSAYDAAAAVSMYYERPRDATGEALKRGTLAQSMLAGIPGASQFATGAGAGRVSQVTAAGAGIGGNRSVETHIGEINVHTSAKDAPGIARDIGGSLDYLFTSQANYGLN